MKQSNEGTFVRKAITIITAAALAFGLGACASQATADQKQAATDTLSTMTRATGEAQTPLAGFPDVTLDATGAPSIVPVMGEAPTEFGVSTLIKGAGAVVGPTDIVTVHYSGWLWDGTAFDSSWSGGQPAQFSLEQVVPGFTKAIAGQTVGSQVIAILPPADGYGEQGAGSIPPNSTLIFVVDILAAANPAQ
jgi:peptidylprolyl isomerase